MSSVPRLVISNSHTGRKVHEQLGYRACEWRIVPNQFDTERFRPDLGRANAFRTSLGVAQDVPLIGLPARLDPMKDHDTFLEAARLLADDIPNVRFVLAGTGLISGNAEFVARAWLGIDRSR